MTAMTEETSNDDDEDDEEGESTGPSETHEKDQEAKIQSSEDDCGEELNKALMDLLALGNRKEGAEDNLSKIPGAVANLMKMMNLKGREKGLERTDTKARSLTARYFSKKEDSETSDEDALQKNSLVRNTHVVVYKDGNKFDYRVLSVVKKYYNKWYMFRPSETPPALAPGGSDQPDVRLSLHLLEEMQIGGKTEYSPVRGFGKHEIKYVFATIAPSEIYEVKGRLGAA